jgi:hypothetical protein
MTEAEARKITDPSAIPWSEPCFVFVSGRYYLGMCFLAVPQGKEWPKGGNVTAQFWRFDSTPNEWVCTWRFRYYVSEDAWDNKDKKSWHVGKLSGNETMMEKEMAGFGNIIAGVAGLYFGAAPPKVHSLIFKGDSEKALGIVAREKPFWLQMKESK